MPSIISLALGRNMISSPTSNGICMRAFRGGTGTGYGEQVHLSPKGIQTLARTFPFVNTSTRHLYARVGGGVGGGGGVSGTWGLVSLYVNQRQRHQV